MTILGKLRTWMRESKPGDEYVVNGTMIGMLGSDNETTVEQFNAELDTLNPKFLSYTLTNDALGYVFKRLDGGDGLFDGNSDARLDPDTKVSRFRPRYRKLADDELSLMDRIKSKATELETLYESIKDKGRGVSIAMTKLEESVMWAVKDLTK